MKTAFRPYAVSLDYIARPGGGWKQPREPESYLRGGSCVRRVSGKTPMSLLGFHDRFGMCN